MYKLDSGEILHVIHNLVGNIQPIGDTAYDTGILENVETQISIVEELLVSITVLSRLKDHNLGSISDVGELCYEFLEETLSQLSDYVIIDDTDDTTCNNCNLPLDCCECYDDCCQIYDEVDNNKY